MQDLPHQYVVIAKSKVNENVRVHVENLLSLTIAPPSQFGGPGDEWSPEDLFMASIASCFILSFKAISKASALSWLSIQCESDGTLARVGGKTRFTNIATEVVLVIPHTQSQETAERLLHNAEQSCLVLNSLSCESMLTCTIKSADA